MVEPPSAMYVRSPGSVSDMGALEYEEAAAGHWHDRLRLAVLFLVFEVVGHQLGEDLGFRM